MLTFFTFLAAHPTFSQSNLNIDSLVHFCDNYTGADTVKLKALIKISEGYQSKNQLKGIAFGEKAIQLAIQLDNKALLADAYQATGKNLVRNTRYPDALVLFEKALAIFKKALAINEEIGNRTSVSYNLNNIGKTYLALNDYSEATTVLFQSLDMSTKATDRFTQGWATCYLGSVYQKSTVALKEGTLRTERLKKPPFIIKML